MIVFSQTSRVFQRKEQRVCHAGFSTAKKRNGKNPLDPNRLCDSKTKTAFLLMYGSNGLFGIANLLFGKANSMAATSHETVCLEMGKPQPVVV
jgi:hypothetical protein